MIYQSVFLLFGVFTLLTVVYAIYTITRSTVLRLKPLWVIGSLIGFVGLGINWTTPDDLYGQVGIQAPFLSVVYLDYEETILIKVLFPVIAIFAVIKDKRGVTNDADTFA